MPIEFNLRHLEAHNVKVDDTIPVSELDIDPRDEVIRLKQPLQFVLEAQKMEEGILVQGRLTLPLECQCVRCLKTFRYRLQLDPWTCLLPFHGEDAVTVKNDCVDLTPYVREDILLEFPQHPLCKPDCPGLPGLQHGMPRSAAETGPGKTGSPQWNELDKLKL